MASKEDVYQNFLVIYINNYYIGIACYVYPKNAKIPTAYSLYNELATSHDEDGNIAGFTVTKTLTLDPENAELDCKILPVMKPQ